MSFLNVIQLLGGLAFFLWGMILARDGLQQAAGNKLRHALGNMTKNRFSGLGLGAVVTFLLQSSSATTVILVGLTSAGMMSFARTVPVILGADIGTTFTVQLISFKVADYALLLVFGGFIISQVARRFTLRWYGNVIAGFGMIFYGMAVMSSSTAPLKGSPWFMELMTSMGDSPILGILVSTVFTAIIQSSAATIGIVLALAANGGMDITTAIALILGANIGTCATAFLATFGATTQGKQVAYAHILIKIFGVIICTPFIEPFGELVVYVSGADPSRQIANAHTMFNFFLAGVFLPFSGPIAAGVVRLIKDKPQENRFGPMFLDSRHLETPALALGDAERELARMGELVEKQIGKSLKAFTADDLDYIEQIVEADSDIDLLNKDIKLYLARINANNLSPQQLEREYSVVEFAAELENAGDVVTKNLMYLAKKRIQKGYQFSKEGLDEIKRLHDATLEQFRLSVVVFNTKDAELARRAVECKHGVRALAQELKTNHIRRLHQAKPETIETTSLHIDVVEAYLRICSTVTRAAYRFLGPQDKKDTTGDPTQR
jgi:phosphate:Na+ symporter